jgi:isoprenylcysteine carboxyl methyltransferase (ICMT) family protein YpbQ
MTPLLLMLHIMLYLGCVLVLSATDKEAAINNFFEYMFLAFFIFLPLEGIYWGLYWYFDL